jgi:hypothetical protein
MRLGGWGESLTPQTRVPLYASRTQTSTKTISGLTNIKPLATRQSPKPRLPETNF